MAAADILVVDDRPENIRVLAYLLTAQGYKVRKATSASMALMGIAAEKPDLILTDAMMPEVDGFELCTQIKAQPETRDIPVIFISALDESEDKVKAFEVGAADFITKPFQAEEVLARVRSHLTIYQQRRQLSQQNALLFEEVRERQRVETALRLAETKYRSIFENATEGIFQCTASGQFLSVNPAMARLYGYDSPEDLINSISDIGTQLYAEPKRRDELIAYLRRYDVISNAESKTLRKDGSSIWVSENIRVVRDPKDQFLYYEGTVQDVTERRRIEMELRLQRQQADRLLINILPYQIAQRLKANPKTIAESFEDVAILFADLVDFTTASTEMSAHDLVNLLNQVFSAFDQLAEKYNLEKIKTIGDAYMVAGGLPVPRPDHVDSVAQMALDMQPVIESFTRPDGQPFKLRIGINTGSVVAGVIGIRKFNYDLWGDAVNVASRMEVTGEPGRIQVTETVYNRLQHRYLFKERGSIEVKGRGKMMTYWLLGKA